MRLKTILSAMLFLGLMALPAVAAENNGTDPGSPEQASSGNTSGGQQLCNKRSEVLKNLSANYKEAPTALGMASNGGVLEVMTSKDGNTWTILITKPDGTSCLVAMGNSWESVKYLAAGTSS